MISEVLFEIRRFIYEKGILAVGYLNNLGEVENRFLMFGHWRL